MLLASQADLEETHHTCIYGLLNSQPPTVDALIAAAERLLGDAIETLEALAKP